VVPCCINIGEKSLLDGIDISREEFYSRLATYNPYPKTSAPGIGVFQDTYRQAIRGGATEVLAVHLAASLSAVFNAASVAAEEITEARVTVFDSQQLSLGAGLQAIRAAQLAAAGHTLAEIIDALNDQIRRTHLFAILDTFEFAQRSGRVSPLVAGLGSMLQIKPLMKVHRGKLEAEKTRTRKGALDRLTNLLQELGPLEQMAIVHARTPERGEEMRRYMQTLYPNLAIPFCEEITPVLGTHTGPQAVGVICVQAKN